MQATEPSPFIDEILAFQEARWISPPEAACRIFAFPLNEMYPHVYTLHIHLPGFHQVYFQQTTNLNNLLSLPGTECTMLMQYFALNMYDRAARSLLYKEIPEAYVWDRSNKIWEKRKHKLVIGRLVSVNIVEGERYYLRLLLNHVRGATSFCTIRTINGTVCATFREACTLLGLLQDEQHHLLCFDEALEYAMPSQLRQLFVVVLAYGAIQDPKALWEKYKTEMIADYIEQGNTIYVAERLAIQQIDISLDAIGKDIHQYGFAYSDCQLTDFLHTNVTDGSAYADTENGGRLADADLLNQQQREIYDMVIHVIDESQSLCVFVDGPGGTGKKFLYKTMLAYVRSKQMLALPVASSGVAAALLPGGRTAHNRFKLPLDCRRTHTMLRYKAIYSGMHS